MPHFLPLITCNILKGGKYDVHVYIYIDRLAISRYNTHHLRICKDWLSFFPSICNRSTIIINYKIIRVRILSFFVVLIKAFCFRTMTFL